MGRSIRNNNKSRASENAASISVAAGSNVTVTENNGVYTVNSTASGSGLTSWSETNNHIIPNTNAQYDIGSAEYKVRHLYLSDNSLKMGSGTTEESMTSISLVDNHLAVDGTKLVKGDADGNLPIEKLPANVQTVEANVTDGVLSTLTIGGQAYALPSGGSGGGSTTLAGLTDVSVTTATNGQSLVYNDGEWQPGTGTVNVEEEIVLAGAGGRHLTCMLLPKLRVIVIGIKKERMIMTFI